MKPKLKEYALYKGDQFMTIGTVPELAKVAGVNVSSIRFYSSKSHMKRVVKSKTYATRHIVIPLGDDNER